MGIGKLGPNRYRVFIDLGRGADGKRRQHTEVVRGTRKEAERRERELLRTRETGTFVDPHRMTVAEYMTKWLESVQQKVEPNTYRGYEQRSWTHIMPDLGHIKLTDLSPLLIEQAEALWLRQGNRRTGGPLDPQTVLHTHRVLHAAMERAVRWRLVPLNPVDGVEPPHVPAKERDFLTAEESERLVAALIDTEYELPILVGLYCGLRPTEYLALRWRDVDLDRRGLRVTQNVHRIRQDERTAHMGQQVYGFRFGPAKTHRSKRPVSMPAVVVELLRVHRSQQAAVRLQAGAVWTDLDLVFTDARGYPHNHDRVRRAFYKALDAAGVRQVVLYALRHTMATLVLHETKDLKLVATRLGHSNEMLVLRTYGHLLPGVDREAADRLGEVVRRCVQRDGS
jgi:integrase